MMFKGEDTLRDISVKGITENPKITKLTEILFKVCIAVYFIWFMIPFYVRPYSLNGAHFFARGIFFVTALFTLAIYLFIRYILPNPKYSFHFYIDKLKPALAGSTIFVAVICAAIYLNMMPSIAEEYGVNKPQNDDAVAITTPSENPTPTSEETPSPTPEATATPDASSTPAENNAGDEGLKIQFFNSNIKAGATTLYPNFRITNTGKEPLKLEDVTVRYYFTSLKQDGMEFTVVSAAKGKNNINGTITASGRPNEYYLEVSFAEKAGTIKPKASTDVKTKITNVETDTANTDGDYSFNKSNKTFKPWEKTPGYISGKLVWGAEPK